MAEAVEAGAAAKKRAGEAAAAVRTFLSSHLSGQPAAASGVWISEDGERLAWLCGEECGYGLNTDGGHLVCHFWTPNANLVRRVAVVEESGASGGRQVHPRLRLQCLRFGRSRPTQVVLEAGEPGARGASEAGRAEFRQAVIAACRRDWPGWRRIRAGGLTGTPRTPGPYQRLLFQKGRAMIACIAVREEDAGAAAGALTQAILWAERARAAQTQNYLAAIRLILPPAGCAGVTQRLAGLQAGVTITCHIFDRSAGQVSPAAAISGNLQSTLRRAPGRETAAGAEAAALLAEMREICPQMTLEPSPDGPGWRFRLYGLEVARQVSHAAPPLPEPCSGGGPSGFVFGCGREQTPLMTSTRVLFRQFLADLSRQRVAGSDRRAPLYALQPERWLEHLLRCDLGALDAECDPRFLYAQVPAWGAERDVLDLLAVDRRGRLLVIELKVEEDVDFPLQALDYWLRVRQHQRDGDWARLGYFPGVELSPQPPRLWLVAPALRWHPETPRLMGWISAEVPWTRFGINEEWRHSIQVLYRKEAHDA